MTARVSRRILARTVAARLLAAPEKRARTIKSLAAYLVEHKMADDADLVLNDIARELLLQNGQLSATVTSARPLTDAVRRELVQILKASTGARSVDLSEQTDPGLLGGLVARTADRMLDTSVRTTLKHLATIK